MPTSSSISPPLHSFNAFIAGQTKEMEEFLRTLQRLHFSKHEGLEGTQGIKSFSFFNSCMSPTVKELTELKDVLLRFFEFLHLWRNEGIEGMGSLNSLQSLHDSRYEGLEGIHTLSSFNPLITPTRKELNDLAGLAWHARAWFSWTNSSLIITDVLRARFELAMCYRRTRVRHLCAVSV